MDNLEKHTNAAKEEILSALIIQYNILPYRDESFGMYIKRIMNFKKLTNKNISDRTGLFEPTISRYLKDSVNYTQENVIALVISLELV